ncbi:tetratricopeptide repeat protein [Pedococcus sp. 2YAF34]|uniref:tetratricopeptide repeat protein n=1 Tax=Pedococcus sp. 2YAF34 TaxID=3233032 RepID=UPI003F999339
MTMTSTPFSLRLALAEGLADRGDHAAAAKAYAELVEDAAREDVGHGTTALRTALARAYFGSAQLGRAEVVLRELVDESPDDGYLHLLLGRTLQRQRRHDEARRHLSLASILGDHERPTAYGEASRVDA